MLRDEIEEAKEAGEVTVTSRAECPFCGQAVLVEHTAQITDMNELGKETCDCVRAKKIPKRKRYQRADRRSNERNRRRVHRKYSYHDEGRSRRSSKNAGRKNNNQP